MGLCKHSFLNSLI